MGDNVSIRGRTGARESTRIGEKESTGEENPPHTITQASESTRIRPTTCRRYAIGSLTTDHDEVCQLGAHVLDGPLRHAECVHPVEHVAPVERGVRVAHALVRICAPPRPLIRAASKGARRTAGATDGTHMR